MWIEIKTENSLTAARRWKELIEDEGVPARLLPPGGREQGVYRVLVPKDKEHILKAVLRTT
jgi:hypothetical protein